MGENDYQEKIIEMIMDINDEKILKCIFRFVSDIKKECLKNEKTNKRT